MKNIFIIITTLVVLSNYAYAIQTNNLEDNNVKYFPADEFIAKINNQEVFDYPVIIDSDLKIITTENIKLIFPKCCTIMGDFFIQSKGQVELPYTFIVKGNAKINK